MIPGSIVALEIFILFLPGFLSLKTVDILSYRVQQSQVMELASASFFALINYGVYLLLQIVLPFLAPIVVKFDNQELILYGLNLGSISSLVVISFLTGLVASLLVNKGMLQKLGLTMKTGRPSVWCDVFHDIERKWVKVHLADGSCIYGAPLYVSDEPEARDIFVGRTDEESAVFISKNGREREIEGPGILLTASNGVKYIELIDEVNQETSKEAELATKVKTTKKAPAKKTAAKRALKPKVPRGPRRTTTKKAR